MTADRDTLPTPTPTRTGVGPYLVGFVLGLVVGVGGMVVFSRSPAPVPTTHTAAYLPAETLPTRPAVPRPDFAAAVTGKTPDEVIAAVGKPDTNLESGGSQLWYYRAATADPASGKLDARVGLTFKDGRVSSLDFFP